MGLRGGNEAGEGAKKKKINEDMMMFVRKKSDTESPRYTARLQTYVNLQQKRRRAAAARRHSEQILKNVRNNVRKKNVGDHKPSPTTDNRAGAGEERNMKRRHGEEDNLGQRARSRSRSRGGEEPEDKCCRRRRRKRSCRRRKRRRRRSCSRRRRRRSCRRRRKRRRRRRRC